MSQNSSLTGSGKRSGISQANNSNPVAVCAYNKGQGCSLLCHPFGVMLLEYYRELLLVARPRPIVSTSGATAAAAAAAATSSDGTVDSAIGSSIDTNDAYFRLNDELQTKLTELLETHFPESNPSAEGNLDDDSQSRQNGSEFKFTKELDGIFKDRCSSLKSHHQCQGQTVQAWNWVKNEAQEYHGKCDFAFSAETGEASKKSDDTINNSGKSKDENDKKTSKSPDDVVGILEVALNNNGGVKKIAQASSYATSLCTPPDSRKNYVIIWTLHLKVTEYQCNKKPKSNAGPPHTQKTRISKEMEVRVYLCEISWRTGPGATSDTNNSDNKNKQILQSKYALVWREYTVISDGTCDDTQTEQQRRQEKLQEGAHSMVRAVAMVAKLAEWKKDNTHERIFESWKLKGPNCAKVSFHSHPGKHFMLKVFDNRFTPTARSPYMWCDETLCDPRLEVEPYFLLHEGCIDEPTLLATHSYSRQNQDCLRVKETIRSLSEDGRLVNKADHDRLSRAESASSSSRVVPLLGNPGPPRDDATVNEKNLYAVPFGEGTVVILRYKYIEGSHWPGYTMPITGEEGIGGAGAAGNAESGRLGSPRCFLPILNRLKIIHEKGYVHGDVRLFNMILSTSSPQHGDGDGDVDGDAVLLDYDLGGLGGKEEARTYPDGYAEKLDDVGNRAGKAGEKLSRCDDLLDLINVLRRFQLEAGCLPVLRKRIEGLKETVIAKTVELKVMQRLKIISNENGDTQSSLQAEVAPTQSEIDALEAELSVLEDQCNVVEELVKGWDGRLSDLVEKINEAKGKSGPDLSNVLEMAMKSLEKMLKYDEEVKGSFGTDTQLDLGLYLVVHIPELMELFNKARKKKKIEVATGSPDRHLKNPRGTEATLKGKKGGT